jgi:hypothetical protein
VGYGGDCTDYSEGCVFDYSETTVTAEAFRFEVLNAGSFLAEGFMFFDFVKKQ